MFKPFCPTCNSWDSFVVDASVIYNGREGLGRVWVCRNYKVCDTYVGCHKGTDKPLGQWMANGELRRLRGRSHMMLDALWKNQVISRKESYQLVQKLMNLSPDRAHIGEFKKEQCEQLIEELQRIYHLPSNELKKLIE